MFIPMNFNKNKYKDGQSGRRMRRRVPFADHTPFIHKAVRYLFNPTFVGADCRGQ